MMKHFYIHPTDPQPRLVQQVVELLKKGGLMAYPTDATYALGCQIDALDAQARLRQIRQLDKTHGLTLICQDLSSLSHYAQVSNPAYRLLKKYTPGPYTFILPGSASLPRRLADPKRKTIGLRIPAHPLLQAILTELDAPLLSSTLQLPGADLPLCSPDDITEQLAKQIDFFIDGGTGDLTPTTIIDLTKEIPQVLRLGLGEVDF